MKITWGHGIVFAFVLFAAFILFMVSKMLNTRVDLVEKDYYAKELKFQQQIDKHQNTVLLGDSVVAIYQKEDVIEIQIKKTIPENISVYLYYPANDSFDKTFLFTGSPKIIIDKKNLQAGRCRLKLEWNDKSKAYYFEKELLLYK